MKYEYVRVEDRPQAIEILEQFRGLVGRVVYQPFAHSLQVEFDGHPSCQREGWASQWHPEFLVMQLYPISNEEFEVATAQQKASYLSMRGNRDR
jgi:hypothetical protein